MLVLVATVLAVGLDPQVRWLQRRRAYNRRQVLEGVNGMLKGGFVDIQHKFLRVFGLPRMKLLLAFTVVGYNLEAIRSFLVKKSAKAVTAAKDKGNRKKPRKGTWSQILGSAAVSVRPNEVRMPCIVLMNTKRDPSCPSSPLPPTHS